MGAAGRHAAAAPTIHRYATVPRLWPGETAVVLASGPSLCAEDIAVARGRARLVAVKDAIRLAPFADGLYGYDAKFWRWHRGFPEFPGWKYSLDPATQAIPGAGVQLLRNTGETGLELQPDGLRTGLNSTYQAINLCVHFGVTRILLLGADLHQDPHGPKYFFGDRPAPQVQHPSPYRRFLAVFPSLIGPLAQQGITLINCSRASALTVFPRMNLREALQ